MSTTISIPCPNCQTQIPADSKKLLLGVQFSCPNCQSVIGLSEESKPMIENELETFSKLQNRGNQKGE